ncbi:MAG: SMI1/KNR4 family protein [Candidatus Acidiferrum sp.]
MQTLLAEAFGPLVVAFAIFVAVFGTRRLLHQFGNRLTPEEHEAARDSFRNRLVHPHPEEVEQGIGAILPQRLLTLYDDHQTILTERLEIRRPDPDPNNLTEPKNPAEWIEAFLPLDLESQKFAIDLKAQGWGKGFCFATDGEGNFYWTPFSDDRQPDGPVFFAHTDPVANEQVAASLEEFLAWPRIFHATETEVEG